MANYVFWAFSPTETVEEWERDHLPKWRARIKKFLQRNVKDSKRSYVECVDHRINMGRLHSPIAKFDPYNCTMGCLSVLDGIQLQRERKILLIDNVYNEIPGGPVRDLLTAAKETIPNKAFSIDTNAEFENYRLINKAARKAAIDAKLSKFDHIIYQDCSAMPAPNNKKDEKRQSQIRKGYDLSGTLPIGYCRLPGSKCAQLDPVEAEMVRFTFDAASRARNMAHLLKLVRERGFVTRKGKPWTSHRVKYMLNNLIYVGYLKYRGAYYPGGHKALVSMKRFNKVRANLKSFTANWGKRGAA